MTTYVVNVQATTASLVLHLSPTVAIGQEANFNCTASGTGPDPAFTWSIKDYNGVTVSPTLTPLSPSQDTNNGDGSALSQVKFVVTADHLSSSDPKRLWCGAIDSGSTSATIQIYTVLSATQTTTADLGASCSSSTCGTANSYCNSNSICACRSGYYDTNGNSQGGSCSLQGSLGNSCQAGNDASCQPTYSRCSQFSPYVCECQSGYVASGGFCVLGSASLGDSCTSPSRTCSVTNSYCDTQSTLTCRCVSGYVRSGSQCVLGTATIGQSCTNPTRTCSVSNSFCDPNYGNTCQCSNGYVQSGSSCVVGSAGLGQSCANPTRTCSVSNSFCDAGSSYTCQCSSGFVQSGSQCVVGTAVLGQSCNNPTRTCTVSNSFCDASSSFTCQCSNDYVQSGSTCVVNSAYVGQSCFNPSRTCTGNSVCSSTTGTCVCDSGYTQSGSTCVIGYANVGESCVNPSRTCGVTNSECDGSFCQCRSGYYQESTTSCTLPRIGQSCLTNVGCLQTSVGGTTTNPQCSSGICACPSGYYGLAGICYLKASVGQSCSTSVFDSCSDQYASCTGSPNPTCSCNFGYELSGSLCVPSTSLQQCEQSTQVPSTVTGQTSPLTPSVTVGATCYEVDLHQSTKMVCGDSKKASSLQSAAWYRMPSYTKVVISTDGFINGDIGNPNLTVSNAQSSYSGGYFCQLCYGASFTQCTNSTTIQLIVLGTEIQSAVLSVAPTSTPLKGGSMTLTCNTIPSGVATSYQWQRNGVTISGSTSTYTVTNVQLVHDGIYTCIASNDFNSVQNQVEVDVQYAPEYSITGGGNTETIAHNFDNGDLTITCSMSGNPAITAYTFYNAQGVQQYSGTSNTLTVNSDQGYQRYSCQAVNSVGTSAIMYMDVVEENDPGTGASTNTDSGLGTGAIAAIVLGIIFLLLLIIIIIVCCCSYGWCRKKEKVEPVIITEPKVKPYIPSVSTEYEEPRYTVSPRYHLKPALSSGPIISMFDDTYEQPRAHQLPALDTQYLYTDEEPRKRHKKRKKHRRSHRQESPIRHNYEPDPRYAEVQPPSDEDLVVVPGKQNYFE